MSAQEKLKVVLGLTISKSFFGMPSPGKATPNKSVISFSDVIKFIAVIHYGEIIVVLWRGFNFLAFQRQYASVAG